MRPLRVTLAALICAALGVGAACAQPPPQQFALLIGNADYDQAGDKPAAAPAASGQYMPDLANPCHDVEKVATALQPYDVKVTKYCDLDRAALFAAFTDFSRQVAALPPRSTIVLYYSGHGLQFDSDVYGVPVLFQPAPGINLTDYDARRRYLADNAALWRTLLAMLPSRADISVAVIIDACRNAPFADASIYNERTVPEGAANQFVYWATNGGNSVTDTGMLSNLVGSEITHGGTIWRIAQAVVIDDHRLFTAGKKDADGESYLGADFMSQRQVPLRRRAIAPPPAATVAATVVASAAGGAPPTPSTTSAHCVTSPAQGGAFALRHAVTLQTCNYGGAGMKLDVFVCQGNLESQHLAIAERIAAELGPDAERLGISVVRVRSMSTAVDDLPGYRVHMNIMRYDVPKRGEKNPVLAEVAKERPALFALADRFDEAHLLPQPGVGVGGHYTLNYISAFLCAEDDD